MKGSILTLFTLVSFTAAAPTFDAHLVRRAATENDLETAAGCKPIVLVMARGSTEPGNMGTIVGDPLCDALRKAAPDGAACQGIGGAYTAGLAPNFQPKGTDEASIREGVKVIEDAMSKCPNSKIMVAGYSQGAALVSASIQTMSPEQKSRINAVVLYGFTKNKQDNGMVKGFPQENQKTFCRMDDGVCDGQLNVSAGHLAYGSDGTVEQGVKFMLSKA